MEGRRKLKSVIILGVLFLILGGGFFMTQRSPESGGALAPGERGEKSSDSSDQPSAIDRERREVEDGLVIIRQIDRAMMREKISQGKEFLFRMLNKEHHGFYKKYEAPEDDLGDSLHTVYSASIIYTFLYLNEKMEHEALCEEGGGGLGYGPERVSPLQWPGALSPLKTLSAY